MDIRYVDNALTAEDFAAFRNQAGWDHTTLEQAKKALHNTPYSIVAFDKGKAVGIGRLIGDGAIIWYIQDVVVLPEYQGQGIGTVLMTKLLDLAIKNSIPGATIMIGLMSAKGKEAFYEKFGFHVRPNDGAGAGMLMKINS